MVMIYISYNKSNHGEPALFSPPAATLAATPPTPPSFWSDKT